MVFGATFKFMMSAHWRTDVPMTLVGGNNFDDQQAFFLPNALKQRDGYNFLKNNGSSLFG